MKTLAIVAILALLIPATTILPSSAQAQTTVTVDPVKISIGYMNVFELPVNGGGFVFGQGWGFGDLTAVFAGSDLTLGAAPIPTADGFWYINGVGGPGAAGNKNMEAISYAEETGPLAGQLVTFEGEILANTLTGPHAVVAFIRDFAPDFSSNVTSTVAIGGPGPFSLSLNTINDPGRHVQYGFIMTGPNAWPTDAASFGTVIVGPTGPVPVETTTWGSLKSDHQ